MATITKKSHHNILVKLWSVQYLRDHVLKGLHDLGALGFLEVGEAAGDDDDS